MLACGAVDHDLVVSCVFLIPNSRPLTVFMTQVVIFGVSSIVWIFFFYKTTISPRLLTRTDATCDRHDVASPPLPISLQGPVRCVALMGVAHGS